MGEDITLVQVVDRLTALEKRDRTQTLRLSIHRWALVALGIVLLTDIYLGQGLASPENKSKLETLLVSVAASAVAAIAGASKVEAKE